MNRTLKKIKEDKWYHIETLKKFYSNWWTFTKYESKDAKGKVFSLVEFSNQIYSEQYIEHPRTKRFGKPNAKNLEEIHYEY